jgi:hypothetical protein
MAQEQVNAMVLQSGDILPPGISCDDLIPPHIDMFALIPNSQIGAAAPVTLPETPCTQRGSKSTAMASAQVYQTGLCSGNVLLPDISCDDLYSPQRQIACAAPVTSPIESTIQHLVTASMKKPLQQIRDEAKTQASITELQLQNMILRQQRGLQDLGAKLESLNKKFSMHTRKKRRTSTKSHDTVANKHQAAFSSPPPTTEVSVNDLEVKYCKHLHSQLFKKRDNFRLANGVDFPWENLLPNRIFCRVCLSTIKRKCMHCKGCANCGSKGSCKGGCAKKCFLCDEPTCNASRCFDLARRLRRRKFKNFCPPIE